MYDVKVGDRVITTVFVCGKQVKMHEAVVIWVSNDGTICKVDKGSLHGCQPWFSYEQCNHLIISNKS
jgi:hypothetical protein